MSDRRLRPTQAQLVFPLLDLIKESDGALKAKDAGHELAEHFGLPEAITEEISIDAAGSPTNVWRRHVRFARQKGVAMGYIADRKSVV